VVYCIRPPTAPPPGVKRRERVDKHIELEQGDDYVLGELIVLHSE
jgi:hypothetical protein